MEVMILYSDLGESKHMTPATAFLNIADFSIILTNIAKGDLPTGSQKPYPLFSESELKAMRNGENQQSTLPWE